MTDQMREALAKRGRVWGQPPNVADRCILPNEHPITQMYGLGTEGGTRHTLGSGAYWVYAPPAE